MNVDTVLHHYVVAALWSTTDENGNPLDAAHDTDDIAPETLESMREEIADFMELVSVRVVEEGEADRDLLTGLTPEQVGHDFWLTRNHHGAGFWDRGLGEQGEQLTKWAHSYGSCDLMVANDGLIYAF